jgi:hypothetical protein
MKCSLDRLHATRDPSIHRICLHSLQALLSSADLRNVAHGHSTGVRADRHPRFAHPPRFRRAIGKSGTRWPRHPGRLIKLLIEW